MRKVLSVMLSLFLALSWSGCERDLDRTTGYGTMKVNLVPSSELIELADSSATATTRASEDTPDANSFELFMYKNDILTEHWDQFSQFDAEKKFAIGEYKLKATYGSLDEEGYNKAYYEGSTKIQIIDRETTPVELTCQLANLKLTVECSDAVKKYFTVFSMQARSKTGKLIDITKEDTRAVYLQPGLLVLEANFEKQNGTKGKLELLRVSDTQARQHYSVKVDVNDGNVGAGTLNVTYHTVKSAEKVEIDLSDASLNIKQPVFTAQGFENGSNITLLEGAQPESMKVTLNARAGIRSCDLIISSPYLMTLGIPEEETVNLVSAEGEDKEKKQLLISKGLRLVGLDDNIDKLALIDFTQLIMNLLCTGDADETSSFTLRATDRGGRIQEQELSFKTILQSNQFSLPEITEKVLIGSTEADVDVSLLTTSSQVDVENVVFEYEEGGVWKQAVTQWAGDYPNEEKRHAVKITGLPDVHANLKIRARYGSKTSVERTLGYYIPDFRITAEDADVWARKATIKVEADTEKERDAVLKYFKLTTGGQVINTERSGNAFTWTTGLEPGVTYPLIGICNGEETATANYDLTTEQALQLPNSDFEAWESGPYDNAKINKGSPWNKKAGWGITWNEAQQETVTLAVKVPAYWVTVNAKTMPPSPSQKNTWYVVPSTNQVEAIEGSGSSVIVRNVGWSNNGEALPAFGDKLSGRPDWNELNAPSTLNYSAGRLFLGSYSYDHSAGQDSYDEGLEFTSRPKQMTFKYKYLSKVDETADKAYVKVSIMSGGETISEQTLDLDHTDYVTTATLNFTYPANCKKATKIKVMFCSSTVGKDLDQATESKRISHSDIGTYKSQVCVTGSEFYIDNIQLNY